MSKSLATFPISLFAAYCTNINYPSNTVSPAEQLIYTRSLLAKALSAKKKAFRKWEWAYQSKELLTLLVDLE
jgi:hypothetical protein